MTERVDLEEFIGGFIIEADELIAIATTSLLAIEAGEREGAARPREVRELFRALHTIKGLAGMMGVEPIVEIAHGIETVVRAADRSGGRLRLTAVEVMLQAVTAIAERVRSVADRKPPAAAPRKLLEDITDLEVSGESTPPPPPMAAAWDRRLSTAERQHLFHTLRAGTPVWTLTFTPSDERSKAGITIATVRARLGELGEVLKVVPRALPTGVAFDILVGSDAARDELAAVAGCALDEVTPIAAPVEAPPPVRLIAAEPVTTSLARAVVRVELDRLDDIQEQLSLLIVSRFRIEREIAAQAARGADVRAMRDLVETQGRQLRDLRRAVLRARLVRLAEVLEPLTLVARGAAKVGKEVRVALDVRDAELDKAIADRLLPAMVHVVRNAIDHAIETADDRAAAGKPREGTVRITCIEVGSNHLVLAVTDDGRGIDRDAIARRAKRTIANDRELLDVLVTPGFSTRDQVSQTSGRGVGMDVVHRIVEGLGGELSLVTAPGAGTTFTLRVPLTIAIVDVFSLVCGDQTFVVPVAMVDEIVELDRIVALPTAAGAQLGLVERRGQSMAVVSLGALLAIDDGATARKAIVIRRGDERIGFAVDRLLGRHEVVMRTIDDPLARGPGIAGATDLGDGRPTIVLDLAELGDTLERRGHQLARKGQA